jgi:glycine betaine transporter
MLEQLPGGYYAAIAAVLLVSMFVVMFVVTFADSATFVLGMFTSKGGLPILTTMLFKISDHWKKT